MRVQSHLVIAAASRMQTAASFSDGIGQTLFYIHMNVFERNIKRKFSTFNGGQDLLKSANDGISVRFSNDAAFGEHRRMGDAAGNVFMIHPLVKADGCLKLIDHLIGRFRKSSAPQLLTHFQALLFLSSTL